MFSLSAKFTILNSHKNVTYVSSGKSIKVYLAKELISQKLIIDEIVKYADLATCVFPNLLKANCLSIFCLQETSFTSGSLIGCRQFKN